MKYFVISDIHSFYDEMIDALDEAGYDQNNKDHFLILCGDCLDRGTQSVEVIKFLKQLPKDRRVFIRGNHEYLFADLLDKRFPESYDFSNGTVRSFCHLARMEEKVLEYSYWYAVAFAEGKDPMEVDAYDQIQKSWQGIKSMIRESGLKDWFLGPDWVDYYELDNFIFVHSFIPLPLFSLFTELSEVSQEYFPIESSAINFNLLLNTPIIRYNFLSPECLTMSSVQ